ncbi:hypothetical protein CGCS363_v009543 [Colletotrichum siamense]|uniref:uncharacterized protein n=1 Tax=Colletotrichum siamense TaxID=690259 RepID=UPI0018731899|nr:uncharacterized protein CGCS363_v009543 [Colletotrichum siamense]KAF5495381.1 hypothetical protein CGCS363_v009543 [Colletotrichum siamense]
MDDEAAAGPSSEMSRGSSAAAELRRDRNSVMKVACGVCRRRKQACDAEKPKCSFCKQRGFQCDYAAPPVTNMNDCISVPSISLSIPANCLAGGCLEGSLSAFVNKMMCDRKDRTMEEIRDYLARIEPKIHHIYENSGDISRLYQIFDPFGYQSQTATASLQMPMPLQTQLQYVSAVHQMMRWGAVWEMLRAAEPKIEGLETLLEPNFTSILMESQGRDGKLSHDVLRPNNAGGATLSYADKEWLEQGSTIYFSTFHLMHPVLDQEYFMKRTLSSAVSGKVPQESAECALVFLTIALAHMASTGGASLEMDNQPPGLHYFNEARRRMGFFMEESTIEAVQVFVLAGGLNLELELPVTSLSTTECEMWPDMFSDSLVPDAGYGVYEEHFYSQISMRRLALDIHRTLSTASTRPASTPGLFTQTAKEKASHELHVAVDQMQSSLNEWQSQLMEGLQWNTNQTMTPTPFPGQYPTPYPAPYPTPGEERIEGVMSSIGSVYFPSNQFMAQQQIATGVLPTQPASPETILQALLRTRLSYLRCLLYRPYIYRVVHSDKLSSQDLVGAEEYLRQCVCWPIIIPPMSHSKRLIHGLYFWSHNLMGILIILRLAITHPRLQAVCLSIGKKDKEEFKRPGAWNAQARQTIFLCVEWFKSLVDIDADARWCWSIIQGLYPELVLSPTNTRFLPEFYPTAMPSQEG